MERHPFPWTENINLIQILIIPKLFSNYDGIKKKPVWLGWETKQANSKIYVQK